jgi:hypothetical protein
MDCLRAADGETRMASSLFQLSRAIRTVYSLASLENRLNQSLKGTD